MLDLNAIMFYKTKFTIANSDNSEDLLWILVLEVRKWMTQKWNRPNTIIPSDIKKWTALKNGNRIFSEPSDDTIFIESEFFSVPGTKKQYWACKIVEKTRPKPGTAPRDWITEIGYEQEEEGAATFSCVITYSDAAGFIGEYEDTPSPTLPKLVTNLLNNPKFQCKLGTDDVSEQPIELKTGEWPSFWNKIQSSERVCPYVYISPRQIAAEPYEFKFSIDPAKLAKIICGNAIVFYSQEDGFTKEMSYIGPEDYICYGGALRIYQPDITNPGKDDSYRHRFLSSHYIDDTGEDAILLMLRRALAQNVNFYDSFFRVSECRKKIDESSRRRRLAEIQKHHEKNLEQFQDEVLDEVTAEEQKRLQAEERVDELELEIDEYKRDNYHLSSQVEAYRSAANRCRDLESSLNSRTKIRSLPSTQKDIALYFQTTFCDKLAFTDDAINSLKECFIPPAELWDVFYKLATEMPPIMSSNSTDPYKDFYKKTGINCARGEGKMTRKDKNLMRQFVSDYEGKSIDIEPHITFPKLSQSIHFGYMDSNQKIVIGHCGEHLDVYSTRKQK